MSRLSKAFITVFLFFLSFSALRAQSVPTESFQGQTVAAQQIIVRFNGADFLQSQAMALQDIDILSVDVAGSTGAVLLRSKDRTVAELVRAYGSRPEVLYAQPNFVLDVRGTPDEAKLRELLLETVRPSVVGIADTGLTPNDPELTGVLWTTPSAFALDIAGHHVECPVGAYGFNAVNGTCDPFDDNGHGTQVARLVARESVASAAGSLRVMGLRFTDSNGQGFTSDALAALEFARKVKAYFGGDSGAANLGVLVAGWPENSQNRVLNDEVALLASSNIASRATGAGSLTSIMESGVASAGGSLAVSEEDSANVVTALATTPTLTSVTPNSGLRGTSVDVTLVGTNFSASGVTLSAGPGITFQNVNFVDATTITATFVIDPAAPVGTHLVSLMFSGGTTNTVIFTVIPEAPTLTGIAPNIGSQNETLDVILTGTDFVPGLSVNAGSDITVTNVIINSLTSASARFAISSQAILGARDVKVTTSGGTSEGVTFTVELPPPPTITDLSPNSGVPDSTVSVTLTGTNFVPGLTADVSEITVSSVIYVSPTKATATLSIPSNATVGMHDLTVTTTGGTSGPLAFSVVAVPPVLDSISPASASQGNTVTVMLTGQNFTSGLSVDPIGGVTITNVTVSSSTTATATFTVDAAATLGNRDVRVTTANGTSAALVFTVNPPLPTLTMIAPTSGVVGTNVDVTLTGTNFVSGLTVDVGDDISAMNIAVTDSTTATATLVIGTGATPGARVVHVTTAGGRSVSATVVFTVIPLAPTLTSINPTSIVQAPLRRSITVMLTGTDFYSPTIQVSGTGVTAGGAKVTGTTSATATFTIDADADLGPRDVTVTTAGGTSGAVTFTVLPPQPVLTSITPSIGVKGTQVNVTLTGMNFVSGATTVNSISDVTVSNVVVVNSTSITATMAVSASAVSGTRDVTVTTAWGTTNAVTFLVADPFPDLSIRSLHTGNFGVGFDEAYTIAVTNMGTLPTSGPATITDTLPTGFTYVSGVGIGWSCSAAAQVVTCAFPGVLSVNATSSLTLTVAVGDAAAGTVNHTVSVSTSGDLNAANDTAIDPTVVSATPSPTFSFVPGTLVPGTQANLLVRLISPFPHDVTGSVNMAFESRTTIAGDDPAIQFATGGRAVSFTIPAGATQARFGSQSDVGPVGFQTGTVAGKLTFGGTFTAGTVQRNFAPALGSLAIAAAPPTIQSIQTSNQNGFVASVLLFSTTREVTELSLTFSLGVKLTLSCGTVAGCTVTDNTLTFDVEDLFNTWFMNGTDFGSLSQLRVPLSIGGGKVSGTVTVSVRNALGFSNNVSFSLQ